MTRQAVLMQFRTLERVCARTPYETEAQIRDYVSDWLRVLGDLTDEQLEATVTAWLRSPKGRFWPSPNELLQLVARPKPAQEADDGGDWPGMVWAEIADGQLRVALLDQATAEVASSPGCMRGEGQRCPPDCDPCSEAIMRRCDELAQQHLEAA